MPSEAVKTYRATSDLTGTQSATFTPSLDYQPTAWEVRVLWTAGNTGTLSVKTRARPTVTTKDVTVTQLTQASALNNSSVYTVATFCPVLVVTLAQGVGSTCTVEIIAANADFKVTNGDYTFFTVTAA